MDFKSISIRDVNCSAVDLFDKRWALLTAGTEKAYNTMTVSWGALGQLWAQNMVTAYVRPSRYTYGFMEDNEYFTLSFFGEEYRQALKFCGVKSGRDVDKAAHCGLTPAFHETGSVYFEEAELVVVCKKLYTDLFKPENFLDKELCENQMKDGLHRFYMGAVVDTLTK